MISCSVGVDDYTPIVNNIRKLEGDKIPVVFVNTGAYCPIHKMHVQLFNEAKDFFEKSGEYAIVGGLLSPSHDNYVRPKLAQRGFTHIPAIHRIEMTKLACHGSDWMIPSGWESSRQGFIDYDAVTENLFRHIQNFVAERLGQKTARSLKVAYLCGADHAERCWLFRNTYWTDFVIAVSRPGDDSVANLLKKQNKWDKGFYLCENSTEDISSTAVRDRLLKGEPIDDLCPELVSKYITDNKITIQHTR